VKKKTMQIIVGILGGIIVLSVGSYYYFTDYLPEQKKTEFRKQDENKKGTLTTFVAPEIIAIDHIHNGDWPIIQWGLAETKEDYFKDEVLISESTGNMMVGSKYMVLNPQTFYREVNIDKKITKKYQLEIYDIQGKTAKKLHTIDMMKTYKKMGVNPVTIQKDNSFFGNGEYIQISNDFKNSIFIELETGKVYKTEEKELTEDINQPDAWYTLDRTNFTKQHKDRLFPVKNEFELSFEDIQKKTYGITKEYPEVQSLLESTGEKGTVLTIDYSQNPPTLEELLKLIIPVGEDPLKNLKTNDGQAITSYEQLEQLTNEYNEKLKQEKKNEED
jgi:hypothetical protein